MAAEAAGRIVACGGALVWRDASNALGVVLVFRPGHGDWSLPKGKLDPGESPLDCALREVTEETGITPVALDQLSSVEYGLPGGQSKIVHFWAMAPEVKPLTDLVTQDPKEVSVVKWAPIRRAMALVTYGSDRSVIKEVQEMAETLQL